MHNLTKWGIETKAKTKSFAGKDTATKHDTMNTNNKYKKLPELIASSDSLETRWWAYSTTLKHHNALA